MLYQHRGLVLQAMGDEEAAASDFEHAQEFGYDPQQGVGDETMWNEPMVRQI